MEENKENLKEDDVTCFAQTNFRNVQNRFGIKRGDRRRHVYLVGKTGMGKSTCMENMIISDINAGNGVCLVDPHGDFAEKLLHHIPKHRTNDVVYFNPGDLEHPVAFNVLEGGDPATKHLVASGLIGIFKKLWADSWGPRLEYVLRNAILALMDTPDTTLLGTLRILTDKEYRKKIIANIKDPVVKAFWVEEYSKYPDRFQAEAIAPIQNKVGQFLSTALIRNIVGQVKSTINLRDIMDNKKILIMNLSKGRVGEDASMLLGAMMITKIQMTAMERIDTPEEEREDFYLYVDEFQNFATESFANILSEARKYRLNLVMAHQYIEQLEEEGRVRSAVFGNVGTIVSFRVGATDSEILTKEFAPYVVEEDLVNLSKYEFYLKLMIDGVASKPFSAMTLPSPEPLEDADVDKIISISRERFSIDRKVIEEKIARWSGLEINGIDNGEKNVSNREKSETKTSKAVKRDNVKEKVENNDNVLSEDNQDVECNNCGNLTTINFKPDGVRPVYCKDCLHLPKEERKGTEGVVGIGTDIPNEPPISLKEAMSKKPQSFSGKPLKEKKEGKGKNVSDGKEEKLEQEMSAGDVIQIR